MLKIVRLILLTTLIKSTLVNRSTFSIDKEKNGAFESVTSIKVAFSEFCSHYKIKTKTNITSYIEKQLGITATRKRIDKDGNISNKGNPIYVYPDIKLRQQL